MARGKFYLDKSNAKIWGVCSGIADYTGIDATWVRVGTVLLTVLVSPVTIPAYILAAMLADKKPGYLYDDTEEARLLNRMMRTRSSRMRSDLADIDRRVANVEAHYSASNSRLAAEIDALR